VIDWVSLLRGFGVPACNMGTNSELDGALKRTLAARGPGLIEAVLI